MNKATRIKALIFVSLAFAAGSWVHGQDWPQWRGPYRDGKATDFAAPESWPEQLTQKWKVAVGDGVASPALVNDRLYVFAREDGNEVLRCLDAVSGKEHWQDTYAAEGATGPASGFSGPRASPAVADGRVVTLGVRGELSCVNAETGKVIWRNRSRRVNVSNQKVKPGGAEADAEADAEAGDMVPSWMPVQSSSR